MKRTLLSALIYFALSGAAYAHDSTAQYIANEGIMVTSGETKILFDPLPLSGFGTYAEPSASDVNDMMAGQGAFAGVDAVFISHAHRDHFSAAKMIAYMQAQPGLYLIAPQQALDMMKAEEGWDAALRLRIRTVDMEVGDKAETIEVGNVLASAVRIPHSGWPTRRTDVQNMVFRVSLGDGATVIHMGDADTRREHFTPHKSHWDDRRTDTAFPPYWFLTSPQGRNILTDDMNVEKSIGVHVPMGKPGADLLGSGEDFFHDPGETRAIGE